jgi:hypothetical protein
LHRIITKSALPVYATFRLVHTTSHISLTDALFIDKEKKGIKTKVEIKTKKSK